MIITVATLHNFNACRLDVERFEKKFPDGLDISGLWGDKATRQRAWQGILRDGFLKAKLGWAISVGLVPSRVEADLSEADLGEANLRKADLSGAYLPGANLSGANLSDVRSDENTIWPNEYNQRGDA